MIGRLLEGVPAWVAPLALLVLALPNLALPLVMDDWIVLQAAEAWVGSDMPRSVLFDQWEDALGLPDCFHFYGSPDDNAALVSLGALPWWSDPELRIDFWRPLASLSHVADVVLFGRNTAGMHLHSLLWALALVGAAWSVLRRALSPGLAGLVLLLFAIDETHAMPTWWLANRNALMAGCFGFLGLGMHLRWRQGWGPGLGLSLLFFALGLGSSEAGLGPLAFVVAWQLVEERGRRRITGVLPATALTLVWAAWYRSQGYGTWGSGMYLDPLREPLSYAQHALVRVPTLAGSQFLGVSADVGFFVPVLVPFQVGVGVLAIVLALYGWRWLGEDREGGWLLIGGLLAALPLVATFALDRLLVLPGLGGAVLTAQILRALWRRGRRRLLALGVAIHLVLPPLIWYGWDAVLLNRIGVIDQVVAELPVPEALAPDRAVITLVGSDPVMTVYVPFMVMATHPGFRGSWHLGSLAVGDHRISRPGPRTIRVHALEEDLMASNYARLFRRKPLPAGWRLRLPTHAVTVEGPRTYRLDFDEPLESGAVTLLVWEDGRIREITLSEGEERVWSWTPGPMEIPL